MSEARLKEQANAKVAASVLAHERLNRLLSGGADHGSNIISAFVEAVAEVVVQELMEAEQGDFPRRPCRY